MIVPSMNHLRAAMWILGGGVVLLFSLHPGGLQLIGGWFVIGGASGMHLKLHSTHLAVKL